jgi:hypothetical protein
MRRSLFALLFAVGFSACVSAQNASPPVLPADRDLVQAHYGKLPLSFEANTGQTDARVKFLARGNGYALFLTKDEAVVALRKSVRRPTLSRDAFAMPKDNQSAAGETVRMRLLGANSTPAVLGAEELPGKANYFIGSDPSKWRTNVPTYAKVRYKDIYPGIDLVYYGQQGQLEYDFIVAPGTNPRSIRLAFAGGGKATIDKNGDLLLRATAGQVRFQKPVVYQTFGGVRKPVEANYLVATGKSIGFCLGKYDHSQPLIIDPVLSYSTYLGGSNNDIGSGIAVDAAGNPYVAGSSIAPGFPTTSGAFQTKAMKVNVSLAFISKLNFSGSALVYSTYLGGTEGDGAGAIALDASGDAYVTGGTNSPDFPTTPGALQTTLLNPTGSFITKLNPTGSALLYSTFLSQGVTAGIAVDRYGNAYVTGTTLSADFPTTQGAYQTTPNYGGEGRVQDTFVSKLNATGSALVYSTYFGATDTDGMGIAVDAAGSAYVAGFTNSPDFPSTTGKFSIFGNGFIAKLNPGGSALVYSALLESAICTSVALDASGSAYATGHTSAPDFPTTPGAFQTTCGDCNQPTDLGNAFIIKLNPAGSGLLYSTFLGGSGNDTAYAIAVDGSGNAYVAGGTTSSNFPTTAGAFQTAFGGGYDDAFFSKLNADGSALLYSSYLGGNDVDGSSGIAVDGVGGTYVGGYTYSSNFPTTSGAFQHTYGGNGDATVTKITTGTPQSITQTVMYQAENLLHDSPPEPGSVTMQDAIRQLQMALFYKLWAADGDHINSSTVFEDEDQAVTYLNKLVGDHGGGFSVPALEGCVNNLVEADRILASTAIADATKANAATLANAQKQLAEGDANAVAGRSAQAVANYQQAWEIVSN